MSTAAGCTTEMGDGAARAEMSTDEASGRRFRVAVLGFSHESNTFAPVKADRTIWEQEGILEGDEIRRRAGGADSTVGGFLALENEASDVQMVPLLYSRVTPRGTITREAYESVTDRAIELLQEEGPWDAVLLAQHGAAVAEGYPDADGAFISRVRSVIGHIARLGVAVDMHANVSERMTRDCDVLTAYQTNPHVDAAERAHLCARLIVDALRGGIRPLSTLVRIPLALNILRQGTEDEPMRRLLALARAEEAGRGILSVNLVEGFPYADVPEMGMSVVVVTDGDRALGQTVGRTVANAVWASRHDLRGDGSSPADALLDASERPGLVVICDTGDNVWGGSPGDSTHLLHEARRLDIGNVGVALADPVAARIASEAGIGQSIRMVVGGRTDDRHGAPFPIEGTVTAISDGVFEDVTPTHGGYRYFDLGVSAAVTTVDGFRMVLHSHPVSTVSRAQFTTLGIDPGDLSVLLAKGVHSPRAGFAGIASAFLWANTAGCTSAAIDGFVYQHRARPMYPFEDVPGWSP